VARSHALRGNAANALALIKYGHDQFEEAAPVLSKSEEQPATAPRNIHVHPSDVAFLQKLLRGELQKHRAIVDLEHMRKKTASDGGAQKAFPLSERLGEYPARDVDLHNIVAYPPRPEAIPVKPIFLDVAWNYIEYPDKSGSAGAKGVSKAVEAAQADQKQQKRGWFGFGRG
jgi:signal recognition particle subunit SRP68